MVKEKQMDLLWHKLHLKLLFIWEEFMVDKGGICLTVINTNEKKKKIDQAVE